MRFDTLPPQVSLQFTQNYVPWQVHFGASWPTSFAYLLRGKVARSTIRRKIALEGHRFTPKEALDAEIVDELVGGTTEDVLARALALAESKAPLAQQGVWGLIKVGVQRVRFRRVMVADVTVDGSVSGRS